MIAHVAPTNRSCDYSCNSLRYAERLKATAASAATAAMAAAAAPAAAPPLQRQRSREGAAPASPLRVAIGPSPLHRSATTEARPPPSPGPRPPRAPNTPSARPASSVFASPIRVCADAPPIRSPAAALAAAAPAAAPPAAAEAEAEAEIEVAPPASKREMTAGMVRELLRCAYDPNGWQQETAAFEEAYRAGDDLRASVERLDGVLKARVALFQSLQQKLETFQTKM